MYLYAHDAILVSCMFESFECINSLNQVITLISWNQRFISLTQGKHHQQQRNLTDGNVFQNLGSIFAGDFLLDMLILLKLELASSCKVFCGMYSGDASSSLQFYNVNSFSLSALETELFVLSLTVMHLFLKIWLPTAVDGICVTSDSLCDLPQWRIYFKQWNPSSELVLVPFQLQCPVATPRPPLFVWNQIHQQALLFRNKTSFYLPLFTFVLCCL